MLRLGGVCRDWRTGWYSVSNWRQMRTGVESGSFCMTLTNCILGKESGEIVYGWQLVSRSSIP